MATSLLLVLLLIGVNAFFSAAEIAVVAVRRSRLEALVEAGSLRARAVLKLRSAPERLFATVQVGVTVVSATAAALGGVSIATQLEPGLRRWGWVAPWSGEVALTLVIASLSFLTVVLGELVPKSLALRHAERISLLVGQVVLVLSWVGRPIVWLLTASSNLVLRPFGDRTTFTEAKYSADELHRLVVEAAQAGTVDPHAGEIAARALEFPELTAADVMIPRNELVTVGRLATLEQIQEVLRRHPYPRLPVVDEVSNALVGFLAVTDLLANLRSQLTDPVGAALRTPPIAPECERAVDLLQDLRRARERLAFVVDERGAVAGMVTMEDLLEELVGDIYIGQIQHVPQFICREPGGVALVSGSAPIRDVNRVLGVDLPVEGDWTTMAGLCLALAGHMPGVGEVVRTPKGETLEVVDASPRRVRAVRLRGRAPPTEAGQGRTPTATA